MSEIVGTMTLKQDIGTVEEHYVTVYLDLHEDGTTTWRPTTPEEGDSTF